MAIEQTLIPKEELVIFQKLSNIKIVFDVGTRIDIDYLNIKPKAEFHLFEPNPKFFEELKIRIGDRKNVYLNNYGLGDVDGMFGYNDNNQAFNGGQIAESTPHRILPIKTLDWYIKKYNIKRIDFLKIDTEGYDYKVLLGGMETIKLCRYIQFEYWNDRWKFYELLNNNFWMKDIGGRNVFCKR